MANTTIPSELIADGSVVTAKIANDAVDADKLASNAVVTASIADDAVTLAKMAANSVDSDQYVDGSIDTIHIADGAVTSAKLDTNIAIAGTLGVTGVLTGTSLDISGDIDVDGTTNLDVVDIDGAVDMASTLTVATKVFTPFIGSASDTDTNIYFPASNQMRVLNGGVETFRTLADGSVFNEGGVDADFRVESDNNTHALFVDGASGMLCIGGASNGSGLGVILKRGLDTNFFEADDGTKKMIVGTDSNNAFVKLGSLSSHPASIIVGNTEIIKCAVAGEVTMPLQPAFSVFPATTQGNLAINSWVTVAYGGEVFDVGNNFANNAFTAPVTGKYQLNCSFRWQEVDSAASYYQVKFQTSNREYVITFVLSGLSGDPAFWCPSFSVLADMDANDTVVVEIYQAGGTSQLDIQGESKFTGYLAC